MFKKTIIFAAVLCMGMVALADDEKEFKAKCPVSGMAAKKDQAVKHNGGLVYFCCGNCVKAFKKDSSKHEAKANHQLVSTGQAKQQKCPFTGGKLNKETTVSVEGVDVQFCCNKCQGKAEKSEDKVNLIFAKDAFKKGFKVAKKDN